MSDWIDIHAHLYDLPAAVLQVQIAEAIRRGVGTIVNCATDLTSAATVIEQNTLSRQLLATIGISPFDVENLPVDWNETLAGLCRNKGVIGIGEIGLDGSNGQYPSLEKQRPVFLCQLATAVSLGLPVVLHSRGAEEEVFAECRNAGVSKAVFHCYTGSRHLLERIVDAGYHISFSGIMTFKNSLLPDLVACTPLGSLFTETDTPYLAPVPHRGERNQPANVSLVGHAIAKIKMVDDEEIVAAVRSNFTRLFQPDTMVNHF